MGDGLVAFRDTEPDRILLYNLDGGPTRSWTLPAGWLSQNELLWVNRNEVALSAALGLSGDLRVMRVPIESFTEL